jgi:hypothetical protein
MVTVEAANLLELETWNYGCKHLYIGIILTAAAVVHLIVAALTMNLVTTREGYSLFSRRARFQAGRLLLFDL